MKPLCKSTFSLKKALIYYYMSRFMSVPSDFILFDPKSPVCCYLSSFELPETEILGITVNYKTLSIICVNPCQRNSGVQGCQILYRIRFYKSGRSNLPQFKGLQQFNEWNRGFPTPHFAEKQPAAAASEAWIPFNDISKFKWNHELK